MNPGFTASQHLVEWSKTSHGLSGQIGRTDEEQRVGKGFYSPTTRTFNLYVSFRYDASAELSRWAEWFAWASEMLAEATQGQLRLGRIVYTNDETMSDALGADIRIEVGSIAETKNYLGLGVSGSHMRIGSNVLAQPGKLVHELGHYAFDLRDEYSGPTDANALCVDDSEDTFACVMQRAANSIQLPPPPTPPRWHPTNIVTEFCTDTHPTHPHRKTEPKTWQEHEHHKSCWATIVALPGSPYGTITLPSGAPNTPNPLVIPAGFPPIPMVAAETGGRFVLLLDRSGSMATNDAIAGVRYAADFWIDLESMLGNELAIVSYASGPTNDVDLDAIPLPPDPEYTAAHTAVANLTPGGLTNITGALQHGQALLTAGASPTSGQTMLLFSDGVHNVGDPPSMNDLTVIGNAGTIVHTVSFGSGANQSQMLEIATATGGEHRHIDQPFDADHTGYVINRELSSLAAVSHSSEIASARTDLGTASRKESDVTSSNEPGTREDLEAVAGRTPDEIALASNLFELEVPVEDGADQVTFVANYRSEDNIFLYVVDPGGTPLDPIVGQFAGGDGHATYTVNVRSSGIWRMLVQRFDAEGSRLTPVTLFAFASNPDLTIAIFGADGLFGVGEAITLRATVHYPGTLTNLHIRIWPKGNKAQAVEFSEEWIGTGQYQVDLGPLDRSGSHAHVIEIVGDETTIEAIRSPEEDADERIPERRTTGAFTRVVHRQIHVGPLPTGEDNDGDGLGTGCCGVVVGWVLTLCGSTRKALSRGREQWVRVRGTR